MHCYKIFLVSTQMVEYPSFYFHANLVFQEDLVSVNAAYSSLLISVCSLPLHKIVIHGHFQHPVLASYPSCL